MTHSSPRQEAVALNAVLRHAQGYNLNGHYRDAADEGDCARNWLAVLDLCRSALTALPPAASEKASLGDWDALRDEVLHNAEGHDNDFVNHYLGLIDSHSPAASPAPAPVAIGASGEAVALDAPCPVCGIDADEIADEVAQSLADSEPSGVAVEGMEKLRGTEAESLFVIEGKAIRDQVHRVVSNALYDYRAKAKDDTPSRADRAGVVEAVAKERERMALLCDVASADDPTDDAYQRAFNAARRRCAQMIRALARDGDGEKGVRHA